jgi:hypothetical protein
MNSSPHSKPATNNFLSDASRLWKKGAPGKPSDADLLVN